MTEAERRELLAAEEAAWAEKEAAVAQEEQRNRPVTGQDIDPATQEGFFNKLGARAHNTANDFNLMGDRMLGAATFGAADLASRHGQALAGKITGDGTKTYAELLQAIDQKRAGRQQESPVAAGIGDALGYMAGGAGLGKAALSGASKAGLPVAKEGIKGLANRMMGAAAGGAVQGAAVEGLGRGGDPMQEAQMGALFGAGGQGVGEVLGAGGRALAKHTNADRMLEGGLSKLFGEPTQLPNGAAAMGKREAARSLMDPIPETLSKRRGSLAATLERPGGVSPDDLMDMSRAAQGGRVLGDVDPDMSDLTALALRDPDMKGSRGDLKKLADDRLNNADIDADLMLSRYFGTTDTKADLAASVEGTRKALGEQYDELLASPAMTAPITTRASLRKRFKSARPELHTKSVEAARARLDEQVTNYLGAEIDPNKISGKGLLKLKKYIDDEVTKHYKGQTSNLDTEAIQYYGAVKDVINDRLNNLAQPSATSPGYRNLADQFATNARKKEVAEVAETAIRGTKMDESQITAYMETLTPEEQSVFAKSALLQWQQKARASKSTMNALLKGDTAERRKLEAIVGADNVAAFVKDADSFMQGLDNAVKWRGAIDAGNQAGNVTYNPFDKAVYGAAASLSAATGNAPAAMYGGARMLGGRPKQELEGVSALLEMLSTVSPAQRDVMIQSLDAARAPAPSSMLGARVGASMAGGNSLMDEQ